MLVYNIKYGEVLKWLTRVWLENIISVIIIFIGSNPIFSTEVVFLIGLRIEASNKPYSFLNSVRDTSLIPRYVNPEFGQVV